MRIVLVINFGSTSLKLALFRDGACLAAENVPLQSAGLADPVGTGRERVNEFLKKLDTAPSSISAVAARGGLLRPLKGGTYEINEWMVQDLMAARYGRHASNFSAPLAYHIGRQLGIPAFVTDPVTVDELDDVARVTGIPGIKRRSVFHALHQRIVARRTADRLGKRYEEANLLVVQLGGGISVGAHRLGRVVDVDNALDGEGPMAPERSGAIPARQMADLCFSGKHTPEAVHAMIAGVGGIAAYLGTQDMIVVRERFEKGDQEACVLVEAMVYQVSKSIGAMAAALRGSVDGIAVAGGMAAWDDLVDMLKARVGFLGPVFVYTKNLEMEALAEGVQRVLAGEEAALTYAPPAD